MRVNRLQQFSRDRLWPVRIQRDGLRSGPRTLLCFLGALMPSRFLSALVEKHLRAMLPGMGRLEVLPRLTRKMAHHVPSAWSLASGLFLLT